MYLVCSTEAHIAEKAQKSAAANGSGPPWNRVALCQRRVELWSVPDPNMDYFTTHIYVQMELEKRFKEVITHTQSGEIM